MSVLFGSGADRYGIQVDGSQEAAYVAKVLALSPIAYWILGEHEGAVAYDQIDPNQNGVHTAVTLGNAGIGDGQVCPLYIASNTNILTATFTSAFNGSEGTLSMWAKVYDVGVWTDGAQRAAFSLFSGGFTDWILIDKPANSQLRWYYQAGGTTESVVKVGMSETGFIHVGLTWSSSADEVKAYYNGVQEGATQAGLGAWGSAPIAALIGTAAVGTWLWYGYNQHVAIFDSVLTPAQIASLASA